MKEKSSIRKLVTSMCANYDGHYKECLPLDGNCYMFGIVFNTSGLCKYFRNAVLPLNPALEAMFNHKPIKPCKRCGKKFPVNGRQTYCGDICAEAASRESTAARVRKHRNKQVHM
ncbi:cysteine-rich VLP domain-containing protein [Ruminococcaceae bacterium OttesenSCG-928-L11]|nr:cysteine-rich VLP domain-containing protein [Ruminococcaceae bacterium OttesenSCG-928-L11]